MYPEFAVADTCFLIDWARFRLRDALFGVFRTVFVPESVLREVKSENTIAWISSNLAARRLALYTETEDEVEEARRLVLETRRMSGVVPVDLPEALCLVAARRNGFVALTENRGAVMLPDFMDSYSGVLVWRALEVLLVAQKRGVVEFDCDNPYGVFQAYESDTRHVFPRQDLNRAVEELLAVRCEQRREA